MSKPETVSFLIPRKMADKTHHETPCNRWLPCVIPSGSNIFFLNVSTLLYSVAVLEVKLATFLANGNQGLLVHKTISKGLS